ncbi:unnamed protein product [Ixodes pacificus]
MLTGQLRYGRIILYAAFTYARTKAVFRPKDPRPRPAFRNYLRPGNKPSSFVYWLSHCVGIGSVTRSTPLRCCVVCPTAMPNSPLCSIIHGRNIVRPLLFSTGIGPVT